MILRRSRTRAATLLVGLLLPAGVPGMIGVHVCPNHGHAVPETSAAAETAGSGHDHGAGIGSGHALHAAGARPASDDATCDGLCELLCLAGALRVDPRVFTTATTLELGAPDIVVGLPSDGPATPRAVLLPFVLPPSHAPPSA